MNYLGMYKRGLVKGFYSEIDLRLNSKYIFVYSHKKKFFFAVPMSLNQKEALEALRSDFYHATFMTKRSRYNPNKAIFNVYNFVLDYNFKRNLKVCRRLFKKIIKIKKKDLVDPMREIENLLNITQERLGPKSVEVDVVEDFESIYNRVNYLDECLNLGLQNAIDNLKFEATAGENVARFLFGTPAPDLKFPPIYIVPNKQSTILIAFIADRGRKVFKYHQTAYNFMKEMMKYLSLMKKDLGF